MADKKDKDLDQSANPEPETIEGVAEPVDSSLGAEPDNAPEEAPDAEGETDPKPELEVDQDADHEERLTIEPHDPRTETWNTDTVREEEAPEEPAAAVPVPQETVIVEKRSGFLPALVGGILAAGLGFVAGKSQVVDPYLPEAWRSGQGTEAVAELEARLAEQGTTISELRDAIAAVATPDTSALESRVSELSGALDSLPGEIEAQAAQMSGIADSIGQFETRLSDLEKRPIAEGISEDAIAAYEAEIAKLRDSIASQRSEVEAMVEEARQMEVKAAADAQSAANRAAAARLRDKVTSGTAYADSLGELSNAGVDIPDPLPAHADTGVASMAALRDAWDPAARAALATARNTDRGTGFRAFLERQTGARSVVPRDGDDPDAVLSRAQANLTRGDIGMTLEQIDALPDTAKEALADWTAMARIRIETVAAADALVQSLNSN
ncbi:COG4223 family protein [Lutimaribacter marinistellae]|uniref:COG4223 family protein n=1 Tax=Lutimaribacter marinistellae TaxID=1820329 RepID=A0ABV7TDS5_9RHOB